METPEQTEVEYIGFWIRFLAFLIDSIIATLVITPIVSIMAGEILVSDINYLNPAEMIMVLNNLMLQTSLKILLIGTLFILFWIFKSATPGKMLFNTSIVDAHTLGKANSTQAIVRYIGYYLSLIPFGMGFLWIVTDPRKQGWHDKIAGTVVIRGKPRTGTGSE